MPAHIPVWVPVVLLLLLVLGYRQSLPRTVQPRNLVALAVGMLGLSLYGVVAAFGAGGVSLALWAVAYAATTIAGASLVPSSRLARVGPAVRVAGSWVPLALFVSIFAARFAIGFAAGVHAPVLHDAWFMAFMSATLGALSGGFGARALAVARFANAGAA